jgi:probable phosphoglycerate mutase
MKTEWEPGFLGDKAMVTHFYAFRHGETLRNRQDNEIQGWIDDDKAQLTENGKNQAHLLGQELTSFASKPVALATSDLGRARDTAKIVHEYFGNQLDFLFCHELREKCHGPWETMPTNERNAICMQYYKENQEWLLIQKDPFAKWKVDPLVECNTPHMLSEFVHKPETIYDVFVRGTELFKKLSEQFPGQTVLISSHGAFNDIMATAAECGELPEGNLLPVYFEPKARHFPKNCSLYHFTYDSEKGTLGFVGEVNLV